MLVVFNMHGCPRKTTSSTLLKMKLYFVAITWFLFFKHTAEATKEGLIFFKSSTGDASTKGPVPLLQKIDTVLVRRDAGSLIILVDGTNLTKVIGNGALFSTLYGTASYFAGYAMPPLMLKISDLALKPLSDEDHIRNSTVFLEVKQDTNGGGAFGASGAEHFQVKYISKETKEVANGDQLTIPANQDNPSVQPKLETKVFYKFEIEALIPKPMDKINVSLGFFQISENMQWVDQIDGLVNGVLSEYIRKTLLPYLECELQGEKLETDIKESGPQMSVFKFPIKPNLSTILLEKIGVPSSLVTEPIARKLISKLTVEICRIPGFLAGTSPEGMSYNMKVISSTKEQVVFVATNAKDVPKIVDQQTQVPSELYCFDMNVENVADRCTFSVMKSISTTSMGIRYNVTLDDATFDPSNQLLFFLAKINNLESTYPKAALALSYSIPKFDMLFRTARVASLSRLYKNTIVFSRETVEINASRIRPVYIVTVIGGVFMELPPSPPQSTTTKPIATTKDIPATKDALPASGGWLSWASRKTASTDSPDNKPAEDVAQKPLTTRGIQFQRQTEIQKLAETLNGLEVKLEIRGAESLKKVPVVGDFVNQLTSGFTELTERTVKFNLAGDELVAGNENSVDMKIYEFTIPEFGKIKEKVKDLVAYTLPALELLRNNMGKLSSMAAAKLSEDEGKDKIESKNESLAGWVKSGINKAKDGVATVINPFTDLGVKDIIDRISTTFTNSKIADFLSLASPSRETTVRVLSTLLPLYFNEDSTAAVGHRKESSTDTETLVRVALKMIAVKCDPITEKMKIVFIASRITGVEEYLTRRDISKALKDAYATAQQDQPQSTSLPQADSKLEK